MSWIEMRNLHSTAAAEESKENNTCQKLKSSDRKRLSAQLLSFQKMQWKKKQPPLPPPPPSFDLAEDDVPPPPPPPPPPMEPTLIEQPSSTVSNNDLMDQQNSTATNSTADNSDLYETFDDAKQQQNKTIDDAEPMEIDPNISETKIVTLMNPLPDAAKGPIFTFDIKGFEESAQQMAQRKEQESAEERMANIIGPKVHDEQIKWKKELHRRLNREEVLCRNALLKARMVNKNYPRARRASAQFHQQYSSPQQIEHQQNNYQEEHLNWNASLNNNSHINLEAIDNYAEQFLVPPPQPKPKEPIQWCALKPIEGIPVPFSWKTIVENWRAKLLAEEVAQTMAASQAHFQDFGLGGASTSSENVSSTSMSMAEANTKVELVNKDYILEEGELIEEDEVKEEEHFRVETPPPPPQPKKKKRRSIGNNSKAKKNLTADLLIVLDD